MSLPVRTSGRLQCSVPVLGFGAFKIGRNQKAKYPSAYDLPSDLETDRLLNALVNEGVTLIDTAPAYGLSEERIGRCLAGRRDDVLLSTKVGETFENGESHYAFDDRSVRESIERSRERLRTDVLDFVFVHSDGRDLDIQSESEIVPVLEEYRSAGVIRHLGFSGKTVAGTRLAIGWADALMIEYHAEDVSHADVMSEAAAKGLAIFIKKGLASGRLPADGAIRFGLRHPAVTSMVVGGLNLAHMRSNIAAARSASIERRIA